LGLSEANLKRLSQWLDDISGMFIATGPTGSGKTTTLYALLHALKDANRVIISLEDPVEYQINGISQIQIDELHNFQFSDGIRSVLRHDPDYLMVGEIRDSKSAHTAVSAAVAGRVLLSTLHSRDCVAAISALRNWGLANYEIAESLSVVVSQRLIRKICPECAERRPLSRVESAWFESLDVNPPAHVWEGTGCAVCRHMGYKGRTGVFELWRLAEMDYELILRHADEHALRGQLAHKGHPFLFHEALELVKEGITTISELRRACGGVLNGVTEIESAKAA